MIHALTRCVAGGCENIGTRYVVWTRGRVKSCNLHMHGSSFRERRPPFALEGGPSSILRVRRLDPTKPDL
eukprot:99950-Chlamydomonas_euryale.AAC.1